MLRSFRLGNHRSFRDEQELLLMPAYSKDRLALPVAAIYGANASGKSNLLDGLRFMANAVRDSFASWRPEGGVPRHPFKLDPDPRNTPSVFVAELVEDGVRYTYGFEVDDNCVREEWLYSYPEKRKRVLFERDHDEIKFGTTTSDTRAKLEVLEDLVRPNSLFLSLAAQLSLGSLLPVYRWFVSKLAFRLDVGNLVNEVAIANFIHANGDMRGRVVELLKLADLGISDVVVDRVHSLTRKRVRLAHGSTGDLFDFADESAGTRSWLTLLATVLPVLRDGGSLVIDEIDASLHPRLTACLVRLFRDQVTNRHDAQLIFTTHDASLLSPVLGDDVLTREDVWFVEKKEDGASVLYPLTDFRPRKEGENLERRYLGGSYGAVPDVLAEDFAAALGGGVGTA